MLKFIWKRKVYRFRTFLSLSLSNYGQKRDLFNPRKAKLYLRINSSRTNKRKIKSTLICFFRKDLKQR